MNAPTRRLVIGAAALAAAAAAWFAPSAPEELSAPATALGAPAASRPAASSFAALPQRAGIGTAAGELFGTQAPPAPKAAASAAVVPAAPTAPPNPYRFAGRVVQDGSVRVFLTKGDRVQEAKAGEELEEGYRVESVSADQVVLVYMPLGTKELVSIETSGLGADLPAAPVAREAPARPKWWRPERANVRAELQ